MYGYGPYTGCPAPMPMPATGAGLPGPYALAPYGGYGALITGADEPEKKGFLDTLKEQGEKETLGIKRKYIALGAVGIGAILVLSAKGMI